ncbi:hypothetical protein KZ813_19245 [Sphingomonas sp. RHCKR7]|uniref:hypothetical protein n=1 Tax=Sphingomonas folli TaxID=2862497 RepID=UPI001CA56AA8|nr:hypothetical protein [Sphingomonas folli]MBW6528981.1 hypothetical protein [Sphingomonas folli]
MIPGATDTVTAADRALAAWEVGSLSGMPGIIHLPVSGMMLIASLTVTFFGDKASALVLLVALAGWLVLAVADLARGLWIRRHPYASARWLAGVRRAVGDETFGRALEHLKTCFGPDEAYVVRRADMALGISIVRANQRDSRRRAEGNMLATITGP